MYLKIWGKNLRYKRMKYNYSKKIFTRKAKPIRISEVLLYFSIHCSRLLKRHFYLESSHPFFLPVRASDEEEYGVILYGIKPKFWGKKNPVPVPLVHHTFTWTGLGSNSAMRG
jgi:hypothetical protein